MLITARLRSLRKVMFSVVSVCLSTGGTHVTTTHDAIGQSQMTWGPNGPVQPYLLGTPRPLSHADPQTCSNLFTWAPPIAPGHLLTSGWLAFD